MTGLILDEEPGLSQCQAVDLKLDYLRVVCSTDMNYGKLNRIVALKAKELVVWDFPVHEKGEELPAETG